MFSVKQTEIVPCQISVMTFQRFWLVSRLPVKIHVAVQTSCGQSTPLLEPPLIILWFLVELKKKNLLVNGFGLLVTVLQIILITNGKFNMPKCFSPNPFPSHCMPLAAKIQTNIQQENTVWWREARKGKEKGTEKKEWDLARNGKKWRSLKLMLWNQYSWVLAKSFLLSYLAIPVWYTKCCPYNSQFQEHLCFAETTWHCKRFSVCYFHLYLHSTCMSSFLRYLIFTCSSNSSILSWDWIVNCPKDGMAEKSSWILSTIYYSSLPHPPLVWWWIGRHKNMENIKRLWCGPKFRQMIQNAQMKETC